jgi:endonuclease G
VIGHDSRLKIPLWVQYELGRGDLTGTATRRDDFRADASIAYRYRSELDDYENSGFDRGHMAPAGDMSRSGKVMSESFLLSNMAPQVGDGFNSGIWRSLERAVRGWVQQRGRLTIITGPIFEVRDNAVTYRVIGQNNVAVPSHFYKIIVDNNDPNNVQALAFMMPNRALTGDHYREYLTTIERIERATGLDFLSSLPAAVQHTVESNQAQDVW